MSSIIDATSTPPRGSHGCGPGLGEVALRAPAHTRARAPALAPLLAGVLLGVWLLVEPRTPDLAGQVYRLALYERAGWSIFDEHWYAGHTLPGYSLLLGPLGGLVGWRALGVLAALCSATLFERIVLRAYGRVWCVRLGACLFALAAVGDVWSGRLTFALGVALALACVWVLGRGLGAAGALAAGGCAAACAAASPVAGVLLVLALFTYALASRAWCVLAVGGIPVALVLAGMRGLFPEGGFEPYPIGSFAASVLVVGVFLWALPRAGESNRLARLGAGMYLAACLLCLLVRTPMGSNVERYGVLLAGPLLLCGLAQAPARAAPAGAAWRSPGTWGAGSRVAVALGAIAASVWIVWGPVRETRAASGSEAAATRASYYAPLERYLRSHGGALVRVEVPLTRSRWEAALLAPTISLARGWEKQLEERYDRVLLSRTPSAGAYRRWLAREAVAYVALPDVPLDPSSAGEGRLIRAGLPYLREVFASAHWRLYAVRGATALLSGPGDLRALGGDSFTLRARAPGELLARIHYSRYLTVTAGAACVGRAPGGWTRVQARAPGRIVVAARFSMGRALGLGGPCQRGAKP